jgi:hypothetical protein
VFAVVEGRRLFGEGFAVDVEAVIVVEVNGVGVAAGAGLPGGAGRWGCGGGGVGIAGWVVVAVGGSGWVGLVVGRSGKRFRATARGKALMELSSLAGYF